MILILSILLTIISIGSGFYWYRYRKDEEGVRIYAAVCVASSIIAANGFVLSVPERYLRVFEVVKGLLWLGILGMMAFGIIRQRKNQKSKRGNTVCLILLGLAICLEVIGMIGR